MRVFVLFIILVAGKCFLDWLKTTKSKSTKVFTLIIAILRVFSFFPLVSYLSLQNYVRLPGYNEKLETISFLIVFIYTIALVPLFIVKRKKKHKQKIIVEVLVDLGNHLKKYRIKKESNTLFASGGG